MNQTPELNRRIVLAARPQGLPRPQDFRLDTAPVPTPAEGQVLLQTLYLLSPPLLRRLLQIDVYRGQVRSTVATAPGCVAFPVRLLKSVHHPRPRRAGLALLTGLSHISVKGTQLTTAGTPAASLACLDW